MKLIELLSKNKISKNIDNAMLYYHEIGPDNRGEHLFDIGSYNVFLYKNAPRAKRNNFTEDVITIWDKSSQIATLLSDIDGQDILISSFYLHKNYQGKNIGFELYKKLIEKGFDIINFDSQSLGAEKLWAKLTSTSNIKIYAVNSEDQSFLLKNSNGRLIKSDGTSPYVKTKFLIATKTGSDADIHYTKHLILL